jgi:hypothetical protein
MHEDQRAIGFIDGQEINVVEPEAVDVELAQRHGKDPTFCSCCEADLKSADGVLRAHEVVTTERGLAILMPCPSCFCDNVLRPGVPHLSVVQANEAIDLEPA